MTVFDKPEITISSGCDWIELQFADHIIRINPKAAESLRDELTYHLNTQQIAEWQRAEIFDRLQSEEPK